MADDNHEIWCEFCGKDQRVSDNCCEEYEADQERKRRARLDRLVEARAVLARNGLNVPPYVERLSIEEVADAFLRLEAKHS